jgi:hypothetical protein
MALHHWYEYAEYKAKLKGRCVPNDTFQKLHDANIEPMSDEEICAEVRAVRENRNEPA